MNTLFYLAPSRKRYSVYVGRFTPEERDEGTVAACIRVYSKVLIWLRVHNVKMHKRALAVADGLLRGE